MALVLLPADPLNNLIYEVDSDLWVRRGDGKELLSEIQGPPKRSIRPGLLPDCSGRFYETLIGSGVCSVEVRPA